MKKESDLLNWPLPFMSKIEVSKATGRSKSSIYNDISSGLFVPSVKTGGRRVVFLASEVNQIMNCWVKGFSQEQIKQTVLKIVAER